MNRIMGIASNGRLFLVSVGRSVRERWSTSDLLPTTTQQQQQQQEPQANPGIAQQNLEWYMLILELCFISAFEIALQYVQNQYHLPLSVHFLSLAISIIFALLLIAKFIRLRFRVASQVMEKVVVWMAVTVFFYAISIPFPRSLKYATLVVYALTIIVLAILNRF